MISTNSFSCMYREGSSKLTANTFCTEGSTSAPNFFALKIGADPPRILQMSLLNFQVSLLPSSLSPSCTLTSPLLYFNNKRECSRSFVYRTQIIVEVQATQFGKWRLGSLAAKTAEPWYQSSELQLWILSMYSAHLSYNVIQSSQLRVAFVQTSG